MVPLRGRPLIDWTIDHLQAAGIRTLVANTHYLSETLEPHLTERGVSISHEPDILETGGGLRAALPMLKRDVVITMNPDCAWFGENPVRALLKGWQAEMEALLMLVPVERAFATASAGDFSLSSGEIERNGPYLYTGLQIIRTTRLHEIKDKAFSLNAYWDLLLASGPVHGVVYKGDWCDIGTPEGLDIAEQRMQT